MRPVLEDGYEVKCATCDETQRWQTFKIGRKKRDFKVCGCPFTPPEPQGHKKCSPKNAKHKGDEGEREVVRFLEELGFAAYRTSGSGAHGTINNESAFATDVRWKFEDLFLARVESKREASFPIQGLLNRLANSDWLRIRADRAEAYWFAPEKNLAVILHWAIEGLRAAKAAQS